MPTEKIIEKKWYEKTKELVGEYIDHHPTPTCLRNHAFIQETWLVVDQYIWLQKSFSRSPS